MPHLNTVLQNVTVCTSCIMVTLNKHQITQPFFKREKFHSS